MLERNYQRQLNLLLERTQCRVVLPSEWGDYFQSGGVIKPTPDDRRRFVRRIYRGKAILEIDQSLKAIERQRKYSCILTKDLSRNGISLLHNEQLYPGEHSVLWLPTQRFECTITRCVYHNLDCYEIGARFADGMVDSLFQ